MIASTSWRPPWRTSTTTSGPTASRISGTPWSGSSPPPVPWSAAPQLDITSIMGVRASALPSVAIRALSWASPVGDAPEDPGGGLHALVAARDEIGPVGLVHGARPAAASGAACGFNGQPRSAQVGAIGPRWAVVGLDDLGMVGDDRDSRSHADGGAWDRSRPGGGWPSACAASSTASSTRRRTTAGSDRSPPRCGPHGPTPACSLSLRSTASRPVRGRRWIVRSSAKLTGLVGFPYCPPTQSGKHHKMPAGKGGTRHTCGSERGRSSHSAWPAACCWRPAAGDDDGGDGGVRHRRR